MSNFRPCTTSVIATSFIDRWLFELTSLYCTSYCEWTYLILRTGYGIQSRNQAIFSVTISSQLTPVFSQRIVRYTLSILSWRMLYPNVVWAVYRNTPVTDEHGYPSLYTYDLYMPSPKERNPLYLMSLIIPIGFMNLKWQVSQPHDGVIKWRHFSRNWPFMRGIHRTSVNFPHKGQWLGALVFYLICAWTNRSVNNRDAGDSRLHRAHYDVTVMHTCFAHSFWECSL